MQVLPLTSRMVADLLLFRPQMLSISWKDVVFKQNQ
jgi:hypothetical protein